MGNKKYETTKKQCQKQIDSNVYVCRRCGGKLTPLETVDNSGNPTYWSGCDTCNTFDLGCPPFIFEVARKMVLEKFFRPYSPMDEILKMDDPEAYKYWVREQTGGASRVVWDIYTFLKQINALENIPK